MSNTNDTNNKSAASRTSARFGMNLTLLAVAVAVVILAVVVSSFIPTRVDLTANNANSLSPSSVELVKSLFADNALDELLITVYVSNNLPESIREGEGQVFDLRGVETKLLDKLEEYRSWSDNRITIQVKHVDSQEAQELIEKNGLEPLVADEAGATVKDGKLSINQYVLGVVITAGSIEEVIPKAIQPGAFEFEITKRFVRVKDRLASSAQIQRYTTAANEINAAIDGCEKEIRRYEKDETAQNEQFGVQGMLAPITNIDDEIKSLQTSLPDITYKCEKVATLYTEAETGLLGQNRRFDIFLKGIGTQRQVGGVQAYVVVIDRLVELLKTDGPNPQEFSSYKEQLKAVREEITELRQQLTKSAGESRVGIICGHGEFCPFPTEKLPIDPQMARLMGGQQQDILKQKSLEVALQVQEVVNRFQSSAGSFLGREKSFTIEKVDATKPISEELSAVVIMGPRNPFSDKERYEIDQYVMRGGTLLVLANQYDVTLQSFDPELIAKLGPRALQLFMMILQGADAPSDYNKVTKINHNVNDLLKPYGVSINNDLIIDGTSHNQVIAWDTGSLRGQQVAAVTPLPYALFPQAQEFDSENVAVSSFQKLTVPYASSLKIEASAGAGVTVTPLIKTGSTSVAIADPEVSDGAAGQKLRLLPPEVLEQAKATPSNGPHTVAALIQGKMPSAFAGVAEVPPDVPSTEEGADKVKTPKYNRLDESEKGRILVITTNLGLPPLSMEEMFKDVDFAKVQEGQVDPIISRFVNFVFRMRQFQKVYPETFPAVFNFLDWAAQKPALAEIRAKAVAFRPLDKLEDGTQTFVKVLAIGITPAVYLLAGLAYWLVKKQSRKKLATKGTKAI